MTTKEELQSVSVNEATDSADIVRHHYRMTLFLVMSVSFFIAMFFHHDMGSVKNILLGASLACASLSYWYCCFLSGLQSMFDKNTPLLSICLRAVITGWWLSLAGILLAPFVILPFS